MPGRSPALGRLVGTRMNRARKGGMSARERRVLSKTEKFHVGSSISESYTFFQNHIRHFIRLSLGPLVLWLLLRLLEEYLPRAYGLSFEASYLLSLVTAAFALVWYRQFLLGAELATYGRLLKQGFTGGGFSPGRLLRSLLRVVVISLALVIPTILLSLVALFYYQSQGEAFSQNQLNEIVLKCTFVVMLLVSPFLVRLSLFTAGIALGRRSMTLRDVWDKTRGYSLALWLLTFRAFLPITIYAYVMTRLLQAITEQLDLHYVVATLVVNIPAGLLTFFMLAIVVAANAEAFRVLIGVREGDAPHRANAGPRREAALPQPE